WEPVRRPSALAGDESSAEGGQSGAGHDPPQVQQIHRPGRGVEEQADVVAELQRRLRPHETPVPDELERVVALGILRAEQDRPLVRHERPVRRLLGEEIPPRGSEPGIEADEPGITPRQQSPDRVETYADLRVQPGTGRRADTY